MITILYVDDEPLLLDIGKIYLEKDPQFSINTALSAKEALEKIRYQTYDAIVSDYQMPEMNGIDFLKRVRGSGNSIPFIIFTGKGREEVVIQALNEGADFYLQKGGEPKSQFAELSHKIRQSVQQRRAETSIRDLERREADIINFLPDATFAIDTHGVVIAWNRAMETMTGIRAAEILGKGDYAYAIPFYRERRPILIDLVLFDDPKTAAKYPFIFREGKNLISEITIPHFNNGKGASIWFIASPLYDAKGAIAGAIESIRDITERRRAEQALRESEERYRNVVEDQTEFISRFRPDGTHVFVNEAYCRYFGLGREDIVGHRFVPQIPAEDQAAVKSHFESLTPQHPVATVEHRIIMPDGKVRWQQWSDRAIFDDTGSLTEYQSVGRDITDRKLAEIALKEANRKGSGAWEGVGVT
jgi:PAS domain S-box-containing protein